MRHAPGTLPLLVLGGSSEASRLSEALAARVDLAPVLSLAGRTAYPMRPPIPFRIGGFGGRAGLAAYLAQHGVAVVVDATHPFAARISANAIAACAESGIPLVAFTRRPWTPQAADRWTMVSDIAAAVAALGRPPRRVFLTTGRIDLAAFREAPQHTYTIRTIDPPDSENLPPNHRLIFGRGPFTVEAEIALLRETRSEVLVSKNSGGAASEAKLEAARRLGVPVILVEPPILPDRHVLYNVQSVLAWIDDQGVRP